ncbi:MAG: endolytic transglycosylase MltG [Treponema sp.]
MKKKAFFAFLSGITLMLGLTFAVCYAVFVPLSTKGAASERLVTIPYGTSLRGIAAALKQAGLVRSEYIVYSYFRLRKARIAAGTYKLSQAMSVPALYTYLEEGKQEYRKVTLPEGITLAKAALIFERAQIARASDFIAAAKDRQLLRSYGIPGDSVEGFLFPDTYFFQYSESVHTVIKTLLDTFLSKTAAIPHFPSDPKTRYDVVILASIIEREYRVAKEAAKIAGVFTNRLNIGMALQSCATIEYIITEIEKKPHPTRLLNKDLAIESPYNTYKRRGLPPSPIANPGLTALSAACNPDRHGFYYFRLENPDTGTHVFTKTLAEHARAGEFILKKPSVY